MEMFNKKELQGRIGPLKKSKSLYKEYPENQKVCGGVSERPTVTDSKSVVAQATGSSNLPPSAIITKAQPFPAGPLPLGEQKGRMNFN